MEPPAPEPQRERVENGDGERGAVPERVLSTATRLFASVGYDGVTIEMLHSAGVSSDAVTAAGGKAGLYHAVMEHLYRQKFAALAPVFSEFTPDTEGIIRFADAYLDYCLERPDMAALWIHRQLADAADINELEAEYTAPFYNLALTRTEGIVTPGLDPHLMLGLFAWFVQSYVVGGYIDRSGQRVNPRDPDTQQHFRSQLRELSLVVYANAPTHPTSSAVNGDADHATRAGAEPR